VDKAGEQAVTDGMHRPQIFGVGVSLGVVAGVLIGTLFTILAGDATLGVARRVTNKLTGRGNRINFELLLQ